MNVNMYVNKAIETSKQLYQDIKCIKEARINNSTIVMFEEPKEHFLHSLGLKRWTKRAKKCWNLQNYCLGHIRYVRGFEEAYKDNFVDWECHHVMETKYPMHITQKLLQELNIYWLIPARYLVFLKTEEHREKHKINKKTTERYERWMYDSYLVGEELTDPLSDFPLIVNGRTYKRTT